MTRSPRRFFSDENAGAMVEFSICALAIVFLMVGAIEFALLNFSATLLEGGMREAARYGITGQDEGDSARTERILEIVNEHSAGLFTVTAPELQTLVYRNFSDIGQSEPFTDTNANGSFDPGEPYTDRNCNGQWDADMGVAGAGGGGEVVLYRISHDLETITGILDPLIAPDGTFTIQSSVAVRNEPFREGGSICAP
jgi:Flp pilus assembly pilin Flp